MNAQPSTHHQEACRIVDTINQRGAALSRSLLIALAAMQDLEDAQTEAARRVIHAKARNDINALIGEVL